MERKEWKKIFHANWNCKTAGNGLYIKKYKRRQSHYIMIKGSSTQQDVTTIVNTYAHWTWQKIHKANNNNLKEERLQYNNNRGFRNYTFSNGQIIQKENQQRNSRFKLQSRPKKPNRYLQNIPFNSCRKHILINCTWNIL